MGERTRLEKALADLKAQLNSAKALAEQHSEEARRLRRELNDCQSQFDNQVRMVKQQDDDMTGMHRRISELELSMSEYAKKLAIETQTAMILRRKSSCHLVFAFLSKVNTIVVVTAFYKWRSVVEEERLHWGASELNQIVNTVDVSEKQPD